MSDRFRNALQGAWKRAEERQWVYGSVGRLNADTSYTYEVPGRKNFIYVTVRVAGGAQTAVPARNDARVLLVPKLAVRMKLEQGIYVIHGKTGRKEFGVVDEGLDLEGSLLGLSDTPDSYVGQAGNLLVVNATEDALEFAAGAGGAVSSVNGQTGAVVLDTDDVAEGVSNLYTTATSVGATINGATSKITPVDADTVPLIDSAASNVLKKISWANIKATLKTYFDTLYTAINTAVLLTGDQTVTGVKRFTTNIGVTIEDTNASGGAAVAFINDQADAGGTVLAGAGGTANANAALAGRAWFYGRKSNGLSLIAKDTTDGDIRFYTKLATEAARINATGMGVGTASPNFKLTVAGTGAAPESSAVLTSQTGVIAVFGDGHAYLLTRDVTNNIEGLMGTSTVGAVFFGAMTAHDLQLRTANVTRVTVQDSTGNVGIGTASPDRKLVVEDTTASVLMSVRKVSGAEVMIQVQATFGAIGTITNHPLYLTTNNTVKASILANGNVGIGTTSPQGKMHVHDGTGGEIFVTKTGIDGAAQAIIPDGTGDVTKAFRCMAVSTGSAGATLTETLTITNPGIGNNDLVFGPGGKLTLRLSSSGALSVFRNTGTETWTVAFSGVWL